MCFVFFVATFLPCSGKSLFQLSKREWGEIETAEGRFGDIARAAGCAEGFACNEIATPVLWIECLDDMRCARGLLRESGHEEDPEISNGTVAL